MTRGTTPTLIFNFCDCVDLKSADKIVVYFSQNGKNVIDKEVNITDDLHGDTLSVTLTQEETLSLKADEYVRYQARILIDGVVLSTPIYKSIVLDCLDDTVLKDKEVLNE